MPKNSHTQDLYNPPGTNTNDWDDIVFSDIEVSDLFWFNQNPNSNVNHCHRKLDEAEAMNTKTREVVSVQRGLKVFQKI